MRATHRQSVSRTVGRSQSDPMRKSASVAPDRADLAAYVANLAAELASLARAADLRTLAYLTDMVRLEAEQQCAILEAMRHQENEGNSRN
jgi:hypothetical protein